MDLPAPFSPEFLADMPYEPAVLFLDRIEVLDREASRIVCRMPTDQPMPFTDNQRVHAVKHPKHINVTVRVRIPGRACRKAASCEPHDAVVHKLKTSADGKIVPVTADRGPGQVAISWPLRPVRAASSDRAAARRSRSSGACRSA